ncbi:anti-sigma factor domain-containing protein [Blastococcus sp. SYSU D00820]
MTREDHERFDELAVGWALHSLEPEDEDVFAAHLPGCPRCARTVAETTEVMRALAGDLPPAEPGEGLRDRLRAAVEETEQVVRPSSPLDLPDDAFDAGPDAEPAPPAPPGGRRRSDRPATGFPAYRSPVPVPTPPRAAWRRVLPNALVAAAVAAILGLGTWNVLLATSRDEVAATAAEQADILDSLLQPGTATIAPVADADGHEVATVVARDAQMQVITQGLEVNDRESTTYVVWGMGGDDPVPLGTFDVVRSQIDLRTVGSASTGLDDFGGFAISIEPGRQAPSAPTEVVANGQVTS